MGTRNRFSVCITGFLACACLVAGVESTFEEVRLDTTGRPAVGTVVATDLDSRDPTVTVQLQSPAPRVRADLISWRGEPVVGDVLQVRYADGDPHLAREAGTRDWLWLLLPFPISLVLGLVCWDAVRYLRRRDEDPNVEPGWWERFWDGENPRRRRSGSHGDA